MKSLTLRRTVAVILLLIAIVLSVYSQVLNGFSVLPTVSIVLFVIVIVLLVSGNSTS